MCINRLNIELAPLLLPTFLLTALVAKPFHACQIEARGAEEGVWCERGFDDFIDGTFGNAGQNLYVSQEGVLQRVFLYSFNGDDQVDLVICNAQDYWEQAPAYVYADPLRNQFPLDLPSDGAMSGAVADLNGDGFDDLVLGIYYNGIRRDLNSFIYYGSPQGYSERRHLQLPTLQCRSVAAGDLNGDGRTDLVFLLEKNVRIFLQTKLGFEPRHFKDVPIKGADITADDLDGDKQADLIVRGEDGSLRVFWGEQDGLHLEKTALAMACGCGAPKDEGKHYAEYVEPPKVLARVVRLDGLPYLFAPQDDRVLLIPIVGRRFGKPFPIPCSNAMAVAAGDVNGDGHLDLIFACRQTQQSEERSWIYWGSTQRLKFKDRTPLPSERACDVAVGDLDGDGCDDVVLCQCHNEHSFTNESILYRGSPDRQFSSAVRLPGEDSRRAFLAHCSDQAHPSVILVNHFSGNVLGNPDIYFYLGGADGFTAKRRVDLSGWGAVDALGCDLDDSGRVDLVVANASENAIDRDPGSYVFLSDLQGLPVTPSLRLPTTRAHGLACADLDRDGYLDLVFCGFDNPELLIIQGGKDGLQLDSPKRIHLQLGDFVFKDPRWIYLADLNEDQWLDLVVPMIVDDRSLILWGSSEGFSMKNCLALSVERAACARAADLDGNGYLDLILGGHNVSRSVPHDSFAYVYWNGPEGLRQDCRAMLPAAGINSMSVADFNKDGTLDLFVGSYHAGTTRDTDSYIYWNRKGRGFSARDRKRLFTHSASGSLPADFNEDGWIDLAIAYHKVWGNHRGYSAVWWNGPGGFNPAHTTRLPSLGPHGMIGIEPGNQRDRGPEEYYQSSPFHLPPHVTPKRISWKADIPPKTWVRAQLRMANSQASLKKARWFGAKGANTWLTNGQPLYRAKATGRWIQYRLALGAVDGVATPRVKEVSVEYAE